MKWNLRNRQVTEPQLPPAPVPAHREVSRYVSYLRTQYDWDTDEIVITNVKNGDRLRMTRHQAEEFRGWELNLIEIAIDKEKDFERRYAARRAEEGR